MAAYSNTVNLKGLVAPPLSRRSPQVTTFYRRSPQVTTFYHPHYAPPDALFKLPKLDETDTALIGVHHGTALLACQIVANNAFQGYLATDRTGRERVMIGRDELLTEDTYWFIANPAQPNDNYPVVPSFQEWPFPHGRLREAGWLPQSTTAPGSNTPPTDAPPIGPDMLPRPPPHPSTDDYPASLLYAGQRCAISGQPFLTHYSHIVPKTSTTWFAQNVMDSFGDIDSAPNHLYLRHDLHYAWDTFKFALVPKSSEIAVHILQTQYEYGSEFAAEWHNATIRKPLLEHAADEYLFAKFAQAILLLLKSFVTRLVPRRIVTRVYSDGMWQPNVEEVVGHELKRRYSGGGVTESTSGSNWSRKRTYSQLMREEQEEPFPERNVRLKLMEDDSDEADWYFRNIARFLESEEEAGDEADWDSNSLPPLEPERCRPSTQHSPRDGTVDTAPSLVTDDNLSPEAYEQELYEDRRHHSDTHVADGRDSSPMAKLSQERYALPPVASDEEEL